VELYLFKVLEVIYSPSQPDEGWDHIVKIYVKILDGAANHFSISKYRIIGADPCMCWKLRDFLDTDLDVDWDKDLDTNRDTDKELNNFQLLQLVGATEFLAPTQNGATNL
jgi:hypothetical protein